jgi:hypothetical protein
VEGICKLCERNAKLKKSHFIPKFIGAWIKSTSITGYIRQANEVHKRAQDIAKEYLLCSDCEILFSGWERNFANKIFYPFVNENESTSNYDEWMSKFCASLTWRTLCYIRSKNERNDNSPEYNHSLEIASEHLKKYLLGFESNLNQYEQHLFPLQPILSSTNTNLPTNINRYLLRTMAMDIIGNSKGIFVYTKLPSFILLGIIKFEDAGKLRASRIALKSGEISPRSYWWPDGFINYITKKAEAVTEAHNRIPPEQKASFEEYIRNNPQKAANSKLIEAFAHDYNRFGNKVFNPQDN